MVVDKLREPIDRVQISVRRISGPSASPGGPKVARDVTDDRGRFRLAGFGPGVYTLTAQGNAPGSTREARILELQVNEGEQIEGLTITFGSQGSFQVSGVLAGVSLAKGDRIQLRLDSIAGSQQNLTAGVKAEGGFRFPAVTEGSYAASAIVTKRGYRRRIRHFFDVIDVRGNIEGLVLRPAATGTLEGTVKMAGGTALPQLRLRFFSNERLGSRWFRVRAANPNFELQGLVPGSYRIEADSSLVYVKGIRRGNGIAAPR